ncbi:MAG: hypothetical protein WC076_02550 [Terrimicrobiaceae bacterium]
MEVRDSANNALLPNAPVAFAVTGGGGGLAEQSGSETASGTLNVPAGNGASNGIAQAWFQGTQAGTANTITAQAGSPEPVTFAETVLGSDRLVGQWNFDDGTGGTAVDSSPLGHDGTLTGGPQWSERYTGEGRLTFSGPVSAGGGDDYVTAGTPADGTLDFENASFSAAVWVKYDASAPAGRVASKGDEAANAGYY